MKKLLTRFWLPLAVISCAMLWTSLVWATTTLVSVSQQELPGNKVALHLRFSGGQLDKPTSFVTNHPPRIVFDFSDAKNGSSFKRKRIEKGAVTDMMLASADDKVRLVINLLRASDYQANVDGHTFTLIVANGRNHAGTYAKNIDPTKRIAGSGLASISHVGFRRGKNGEGRVVVDYNGAGIDTNVEQRGSHVIVNMDNVRVPKAIEKTLDVTDFATPVSSIQTSRVGKSKATLQLDIQGKVRISTYQKEHRLIVAVATKKSQKGEGQTEDKKHKYKGSRVSFNFQDIPVRAALQLIAEESKMNIVAADSVQGNVTLKLDNVPWDQALDVILRSKKLDQRRDQNVVWVAPQKDIAEYEQSVADARIKARNSAPLKTAYIPISYGKAKDIADLLTTDAQNSDDNNPDKNGHNRGFLSTRGSVSYDERTNTLLINDTENKIREIKNMVAVLDRPVKQVLIQARIVAATDNFSRELGAKWGVKQRKVTRGGSRHYGIGGGVNSAVNAANGTFSNFSNGGYNVNLPLTDAAGSVGLAILGKNFLVGLELQAAQTEGRTEIISSPRVITANQQQADIKQGKEIGYVTYTTGANGVGTPNVQFKDALLELKVTPTITADGRVFLRINVNQDSLADFVDSPGGGKVPLLNKRAVNTSVLVDDGQTVVLGGIYEVNKENSLTKIPGLGDIPILGALFRKTTRSNEKAELLVFVTPRILTSAPTAEH